MSPLFHMDCDCAQWFVPISNMFTNTQHFLFSACDEKLQRREINTNKKLFALFSTEIFHVRLPIYIEFEYVPHGCIWLFDFSDTV